MRVSLEHCFKNVRKPNDASLTLVIICSCSPFSIGWHSTAIDRLATRCKRSGICPIGKQFFYNMFEFAALRLWTKLLSHSLCLCLFCCVHLWQKTVSWSACLILDCFNNYGKAIDSQLILFYYFFTQILPSYTIRIFAWHTQRKRVISSYGSLFPVELMTRHMWRGYLFSCVASGWMEIGFFFPLRHFKTMTLSIESRV